MSREIKTFDLDNALQDGPGRGAESARGAPIRPTTKWKPEVYFYRFDYPDGFGAGLPTARSSRRSTMAAPSSTMASTPRPPRRAMPCATPGASALAILGTRPASTIRSTLGRGRPMPTTIYPNH